MSAWQRVAVIPKFIHNQTPKDSSEPSEGSSPPTTFL